MLTIGYEDPTNIDGDHHFTGYINKEFLVDKVTEDTICYVCGPVPFLKMSFICLPT